MRLRHGATVLGHTRGESGPCYVEHVIAVGAALNETLPGLGLPDACPFVISPPAADNPRSVDRNIRAAANQL